MKKITRKEFIKKLPVGAAFAFSIACMGGCAKLREETPYASTDPFAEKIDFIIDLDDPKYVHLRQEGNYAFKDNVIIVFTEDSQYVSATKICSDEFLPDIIWENGEYLCLEHGATFDRTGKGTETYNDLGKNGIEVYQTELNGSMLRVFQ